MKKIARLEIKVFAAGGEEGTFKSRGSSHTNVQYERLFDAQGIVLQY
jgi:hypothetical protein